MVSATGKTLSAARLFLVAKASCERLKTIDPPTKGGQDDSLAAMIFSAASIEAFFSELPELLCISPEVHRIEPPQIRSYVGLASEVEANKGSVKLKYLLAYSVLSGQPCDKGGHPYQDFALLVEARNSLMHMKPSNWSGELRPDGTIGPDADATIVEKFRSKGILDTSQPTISGPVQDPAVSIVSILTPIPFTQRISTRIAAIWACNTAADVIGAILKAIPNSPHKQFVTEYCKAFQRTDEISVPSCD
jgi:hypothetical protein